MERGFDPTVFTQNGLRLLEQQVGQQMFAMLAPMGK